MIQKKNTENRNMNLYIYFYIFNYKFILLSEMKVFPIKRERN
jgi:hypothetical protein